MSIMLGGENLGFRVLLVFLLWRQRLSVSDVLSAKAGLIRPDWSTGSRLSPVLSGIGESRVWGVYQKSMCCS